MPSPYGDCRDDLSVISTDSIYYNLTCTLSSQYYQRLCYEIYIILNSIIPNCNCTDPSLSIPNINNLICKTANQLSCVNSWKNAFNYSIPSIDCPLECNYVVYSTSLNSASYPTSYYATILQQNQHVINKFNNLNVFNPSILTSISSNSQGAQNKSHSGKLLFSTFQHQNQHFL